MSRKRRIAGSMAALLAVLASLFVATATQASAADKVWCNSNRTEPPPGENYKFVSLPHAGYVVLMIDQCVARVERPSQRAAFSTLRWKGDYTISDPFRSFKLTIRLERADKVEKTHTCDLTAEMNDYPATPNPGGAPLCKTSWLGKAPRYQWTGDGVLKYDLRDDGIGTYTWNLRGSPEIY